MTNDLAVARQLIDALPQRQHIKEEDIERWLHIVSNREHDHGVLWHVRRLTGFGGSEIGALTLNYRNERATFGSAEKIVQQKLLQIPPLRPDYVMRRGTLMEPVVAEVFHGDYGAKRLQPILDAIQNSYSQGGGNLDHPWERVYPDDVVEVARKLYVVDYKCPGEAPTDGMTSYEYACQVHQGHAAIKRVCGIVPDGMLVINWNHSKGVVVPIEVPWSDHIYAQMMEAGDHYWQMVLDGEVPDRIQAIEVDPPVYSDAVQAEIHTLEKEIAVLGLLQDDIGEKYSQAFDRLTHLVTQGDLYPLEVMKQLPLLSTTLRKKLDSEAVTTIASLHDYDDQTLLSETGRLDATAMAEKLKSLGHGPIYQKTWDQEEVEKMCDACSVDMPYTYTVSGKFKANKQKNISKEDVAQLRATAGLSLTNCLTELRGDEPTPSAVVTETADENTAQEKTTTEERPRRVAGP